jgi:hypothetical protein
MTERKAELEAIAQAGVVAHVVADEVHKPDFTNLPTACQISPSRSARREDRGELAIGLARPSPSSTKAALRVEENLVDQLFNSSEKRLARSALIGKFWQERKAGAGHREGQPRDARGHDRHDALPCESFHE